jgi:ATP-dependent helicase HrpA
VGGDYDTRAPFFAHNHKLVKEIENLEHKSRRLDVLVDDQLIAAFYDKQIPSDIVNGAGFEKWYKDASRDNPKLLYLNREELMRHEAAGVTTELFPKTMNVTGIEMALSYHFEPGSPRDGVTLAVPLFALNQIPRERADWLVPGMLKEKVHLLLKSLPQKLRRHCVPLPEYAANFFDRNQDPGTLRPRRPDRRADCRHPRPHQRARADHRLQAGNPAGPPLHEFQGGRRAWPPARHGPQPGHLQAELGGQARQSFQRMAEAPANERMQAARAAGGVRRAAKPAAAPGASAKCRTGGRAGRRRRQASASITNITSWSFGELPELLEIKQGKLTLIGFPALVDKGTTATWKCSTTPTWRRAPTASACAACSRCSSRSS